MHDKDIANIQDKLRDMRYTIALIEQILQRKQNAQVILPVCSVNKLKDNEQLRNALVVHSD